MPRCSVLLSHGTHALSRWFPARRRLSYPTLLWKSRCSTSVRSSLAWGICPPYVEVSTIADFCPKESNSIFSITYPSIEPNTLVSIRPLCTAYGSEMPLAISWSGKSERSFGTESELRNSKKNKEPARANSGLYLRKTGGRCGIDPQTTPVLSSITLQDSGWA